MEYTSSGDETWLGDQLMLSLGPAGKLKPGKRGRTPRSRNSDNPTELKFSFSNAPADTPLLDLVRLSGLLWPIEIIFEEGKVELGFDRK